MQKNNIGIGVVILIACLVGLLHLLPHYSALSLGLAYNTLDPQVVGQDEAVYAAGVMQVLDGELFPTDLAVYEHKTGPNFYGWLPFQVMAGFTLLVGGIENALIFSDALFSALAFLLFYILSNQLLKSNKLSLLASLTFVFFYRVFIPPGSLSISGLVDHILHNLLHTGSPPIHLWFARFVQPQVSILFFLGCLIALYLAVSKHSLKWYVFCGILLAANFYSYFYYWTFLVVVVGLLFVVLLFRKSYKRMQGVILTSIIGCALAIPYFLNLLSVKGADFSTRSGLEVGRFIEPISVAYVLLFVIVFWLFYKRSKEVDFLAILALSSIIVLNVQLLLGFTVQNNHWNSRAIVPVLILLFFFCIKRLLEKIKSLELFKRLFIPALIIALLLSVNLAVKEAQALEDTMQFTDEQSQLLSWLQTNTKSGDVILSSDLSWNLWIPAYTHSDVYFPYAVATLSSDKEMQDRFITSHKLLGFETTDVSALLQANSRYSRYHDPNMPIDTQFSSSLKSYIFVDRIFPIEHQGFRKYYTYNDTLVTDLIEQYDQSTFTASDVFTYKVDYVLLVGDQKNLVALGALGPINSTTVFENQEFVVISVENLG